MTIVIVTTLGFVPGLARADEKAACIAAFDSGQALRAAGKLTQALTQFAVCTRDVCPRSLQRVCVEQATESSALLPSIVLSVTGSAHVEMTDVKVSVDGAVVATVLDGKALPIDPGIHTFRFESPRFPVIERQLPVKEAQKGQLIAVSVGPVETVQAPPQGQKWSTLRWVGVGAGAAGVVGIVVGSVFGAMALSEYGTAQHAPYSSMNVTFNAARTTGENDAAVSTGAFIAGAALAATGIVLFVVHPSRTSSTSVSPTLGGLRVLGTF
jgi:serine/threonine-protein kinase